MTKSKSLPESAYLNVSQDFVDRFFQYVAKTEGCWYWKGYNIRGYGKFFCEGRCRMAHRISWAMAYKRDVPDGLGIMHTCDNPSCVNPDHLVPATQKDNMRDAIAKGRKYYVPPSLFCVRGHPRSEDTVRFSPSGKRVCRVCERQRWERRKALR